MLLGNIQYINLLEKAIRETDTLDTFVDSSWYFLRFCAPNNDDSAIDENQVKYWMPVDQYIEELNTQFSICFTQDFLLKGLALMKI